jgi:CheY-like chemotaxis protein
MKNKIFVVDDDASSAVIVEALVGNEYDVESFLSPKECIDQLVQGNIPDVFLLDVQMPEMDGYELCQTIKGMDLGRNVPVIFISSCDAPEDIMMGYEVGAEDYVVKPFERIGLSQKISRLLRIEHDRQALLSQAADAELLSGIFMDNANEYAVLIKYLRTLNECSKFDEVIRATLKTVEAYQLSGSVQIRMRDVERTLGTSGENWPMELAVLSHVKTLGRIFEFKTRCVYNYGPVTILVNNVPIHDPDRCGRIRDNLAIVAECAEAKLLAIESNRDKIRLRTEIKQVMDQLAQFVTRNNQRFDEAKATGGMYSVHLSGTLTRELGKLGVTCQQEDQILDLVSEQIDKLVDLFAFAGESADELSQIRKKFDELLTVTTEVVKPRAFNVERHNSNAAELF